MKKLLLLLLFIPLVSFVKSNITTQERSIEDFDGVSVRLDVFTHNLALEYVKKEKPKVLYLAYGETDDFAHMGDYDQYIKSLHNNDKMISELWSFIQSDKFYKDNTYLIISTEGN